MPKKSNNRSAKKSYVKPDGSTMTQSEQEALRQAWREQKKRAKPKPKKKKVEVEEKTPDSDVDKFDFDPRADLHVSYSPPSSSSYPFDNFRYVDDAEKKMIEQFKDEPLSSPNTPTKPNSAGKKGGKTRKNKKR